MEWTKRKDFKDYLREAYDSSPAAIVSEDNAPSFLFSIPLPQLKKTSGYKIKTLSIEERKLRFLEKLDEGARSKWQRLESVAKEQGIMIFPWDPKAAFRKLALRLHPDHSKALDASEKFQAVKRDYDLYMKAIANVCI